MTSSSTTILIGRCSSGCRRDPCKKNRGKVMSREGEVIDAFFATQFGVPMLDDEERFI
jgi:hypothetical protein